MNFCKFSWTHSYIIPLLFVSNRLPTVWLRYVKPHVQSFFQIVFFKICCTLIFCALVVSIFRKFEFQRMRHHEGLLAHHAVEHVTCKPGGRGGGYRSPRKECHNKCFSAYLNSAVLYIWCSLENSVKSDTHHPSQGSASRVRKVLGKEFLSQQEPQTSRDNLIRDRSLQGVFAWPHPFLYTVSECWSEWFKVNLEARGTLTSSRRSCPTDSVEVSCEVCNGVSRFFQTVNIDDKNVPSEAYCSHNELSDSCGWSVHSFEPPASIIFFQAVDMITRYSRKTYQPAWPFMIIFQDLWRNLSQILVAGPTVKQTAPLAN